MSGYLITFKPCGHVTHSAAPVKPGQWLTHWEIAENRCQTPREVASVRPCPGCPGCWQQPALVLLEAA